MAWIARFYHEPERFDEDEHIRTRLANLLNARREFSSQVADLGLEELGRAASTDGVSPAYLEDMKAMIEQWEPRVRVIRLVPIAKIASLRPGLSLEVETLGSGRRLNVTFGRDVPPLPTEGGR